MALRNVVVEGDDILRKVCRPYSEVTDRTRTLLDDMIETMRDSMGVGIAAPQVGIMRRAFVIEPEPGTGEVIEFINPEILESSGEQWGVEGCLSVPGKIGDVKRPTYVKVKALDRNGEEFEMELDGFYATVFCHENDHLDGTLYIDKAINIRYADDDEEEEE